MASFEIFANEVVVDALETVFYGKNLLPILSITFPNTSGWEQVLSESSEEDGPIYGNLDWSFEIEVLLTGKKYLKYCEDLGIPNSAVLYFSVFTNISLDCKNFPGSYMQPAECDVDIKDVDNDFDDEVSVGGESIGLTGRALEYFKGFSKKHRTDTDEDLEYIAMKNWNAQPLAKIIKSGR